MTTALNGTHLRVANRRDRLLRAGMQFPTRSDLSFTIPAGVNITDPTIAAERDKSITIVSRLVHDGVPEGLLVSIGTTTKGLAIGFDSATGTAQFIFRSAVAAGSIIDLAIPDTSPTALSEGEHTYVFTVRAGSTGYSAEAYVDGRVYARGTSSDVATWSAGTEDWYHALTAPSPITGYTPSATGLTNALPLGELEVILSHAAGVVGV